MALTMTRTRTQTALTKLALMVASIHGELAFVEDLIATCAGTGSAATAAPGIRTNTGMQAVLPRLERRRQELVHNRDALYATIRQFDPKIAPQDTWLIMTDRASSAGVTALTEMSDVSRFVE